MSSVFVPPGLPTDLSGKQKHMNSLSNSLPAHVVASGSAANADHVGERAGAPAAARVEPSAGWDSYEVWRRCIKDARDRRQLQE
jgi:hypothetical protein